MEVEESSSPLAGADRRLRWPGFSNARDLGGLLLDSGRRTRYGVVVRSDLPGAYAEVDRGVLAGYGVRTVLDIRSPMELVQRPSALRDLPGYVHLPMMLDRDMEQVRDFRDMAQTYRWQVDNRGESISAILNVMAEERPGGLLFHCLAGKDRTGVIAALVLTVAGADRATVLDDYLLSDGTVPAEFRPLPEMMDGLFDHLDLTYGGVSGYLAWIGVDAATQEALRRRLID
ncbi:MAG: tyrosine-protein phosphatase [Acidimicrobiaceae bacterium]|nr:tyrosine-protein phosphatase [Acidimicrobiaceae bacterium]